MKTNHNITIGHYYHVECIGADGNLKWKDEFENLVVTTGRDRYLDATIKTGFATPLWYVGLKGAGTVLAADTMASHAGWAELVPYSQAARPGYTTGAIAAGSVDNSASKAVFTINGTATVAGAFLANDNTKSGTTGILLGAGDFSVARAVIDGDTLNVTVTCSITSS